MYACKKSREHFKLQSQGQKKKKEVQEQKKLGKKITHSFHRPLMIWRKVIKRKKKKY